MTLRRILTRLICAGAVSFSALAAQADTLADSMTLAYRNSGLLDQNRALLRAADEDVAQAVSALRPILSWSAGLRHTRAVVGVDAGTTATGQPGNPAVVVAYPADTIVRSETEANITLSASLLLHDFGASQHGIDAAREMVLATRQSLIGAEQRVLLRAVQAHMELRRATEVLAVRRSNLTLLQRELRAAQDRFDVGEVTRTDVSFAEARLAGARAQVTAAEGDVARAQAEYRAAVGQAPGTVDAGRIAQLGRSQSEAEAWAVRNHPAVVEIRHNVAAAELNVERAKASMMPRTSLSGQMQANDEGDLTQSIGITIGGPLYQGGRLSSMARQAMARRDAARAGMHVVADQVRQQVANAYVLLEVTRQSATASEQQSQAALAAFDGIREEASLGARTTIDVLNAEQSLLDARVAVISARIDRVIASYNALAAMGLLTAAHLNLPVTLYDPTVYYQLAETAPTARSAQGQALDRVIQAIGAQ